MSCQDEARFGRHLASTVEAHDPSLLSRLAMTGSQRVAAAAFHAVPGHEGSEHLPVHPTLVVGVEAEASVMLLRAAAPPHPQPQSATFGMNTSYYSGRSSFTSDASLQP
ncbi:hypothetical protein JCM33774_45920 [Actinophytocola sp. KF-1]